MPVVTDGTKGRQRFFFSRFHTSDQSIYETEDVFPGRTSGYKDVPIKG
jgi:hypothetical protein